jgi:mevalonate kinase
LDQLVDAAQKAGAFGAKLSGGGRGGNMITLVSPETLPAIRAALIEAGAVRVFDTVLE